VRKTWDGRLQISVNGPPAAFSGRALRAAGTRRILSLYPWIRSLTWDDEWSGWIGMTRSGLPHVWQVEPGLTAAVGMNGRGIAMATLLGRDIALRLTGAMSECFMPSQPPRPWPMHGALHLGVSAAMRWYRLRDHLELRRGGSAAPETRRG
jgi:glycine/D-amino acid oxidase-like deaminating enzyme